MPNRISRLLLLLLVTLLTGCEGAGPGSYMSIGTGNTGGIYYPFGGALASRLTALDPERQFTAEVTAASVENVKRLEQGQIDLGFSITTTIVGAFEGGRELFPDPIPGLRVIAPMWPNPLTVLVPGNSDVQSLRDARGMRISVGGPGSGTEQVSRMLLPMFGMSYDDIDARFLSFTESSAGIRDGSLDVGFIYAAYPASAVLEATTTGDARIIPVEGPEIDAFIEAYPFFFRYEIPAGAYRGVDAPVPTIAELNWVVAMDTLPDDVVTMVLDIMLEERDRLIQVNAIVRQIDLTDLGDSPIPLHPAAEAWFEAHEAELRSPAPSP